MNEAKEPKSAIIFAGGEILDYEKIKNLIKQDTMIVCADSGYDHCEKLGVKPQLIVGDMDSLEDPPNDVRIEKLPVEKDYSDTMFAVQFALEHGCSELVLAGMLGGKRFDHSLSNLQTLVFCARRGLSSFITDGVSTIYALDNYGAEPTEKIGITFFPVKDHLFSVVCYSDICRSVSIEGAKYILENKDMSNTLPRGISNEFLDTPVNISFENGTLLLIITPK